MTGRAKSVLVLGMHRSGTSVLTGVLSCLGIDAGPLLMPGHAATNPKGFWEHPDIVTIHDDLLESIGAAWDDERAFPVDWWKWPQVQPYRKALSGIVRRDFSKSRLWVLKDPRLCRLVPLWLDILRELEVDVFFFLNLRNPAEVADSLAVRNGFSSAKSHLLWLQHVLDAEKWSRGHPRAVVTYERLLSDWVTAMENAAQSFPLLLPLNDPLLRQRVDALIEPSFCHNRADQTQASDDELAQLSHQAYQIAMTVRDSELSSAFSSIKTRIDEIATTVAPWSVMVRGLERENAFLSDENKYLKEEIVRIKSTFSWQVTKPLRLIGNLPKNVKKLLAG